jgi:hypothetical protein
MAEPEADNLRLAQNAQDVDISDETQDFRFLNLFGKYVQISSFASPFGSELTFRA